MHQHHPDSGDRCGAESEFRPSRRADGIGAGGIRCGNSFCVTTPRIRFGRIAIASCSPRPRLDAAVFDALSSGVRRVKREHEVTDELSVSLEEIKQFRQLGSRTPGIPSRTSPPALKPPPGRWVKACGNSVGMAIAGKWLAASYNRPGFEIFNYNIYAICGDGDMMEGVATEAASLAGHLKLSQSVLDLRQQ